jgi:serine protease Do
MTRILPVFGLCLDGARPSFDGRRAGGMARLCTRLGHIALLLVGMGGLSAVGTTASAAMPPGSACNVVDVVAHALPAIVNITVVRVDNDDESGDDKTVSAASGDKSPPNEHIAVFVGAGEVIDPTGIIVTNRHVIQGAAMIRVIFNDKTEVPAKLIAACSVVDLALLKVDVPRPLPTLKFANSDKAELGQPVIAVGNPLGVGTSISTGVISGLNRDLMRTPFDDFLQTDASINPGNSGGPLLDCDGEIIGVNTALLSNNSSLLGSIGLGFALPANDAKLVASKLRYPDTDMPNWTGLHLQDLTEKLATVFGRPDMQGAIVTGVEADSPAAQANLLPGDIVTGVDGHAWPDSRAVLRSIVSQPSRALVNLDVWRKDHMMDVAVQTAPWPNMTALRSAILASPEAVKQAEAEGIGLHLAAISDQSRAQYHLKDASGVLIDQVIDGSEASNMGLAPGLVVEKVDMQPVTTPEEVQKAFAQGNPSNGDFVALLVHGQYGSKWVPLFVGHINLADLLAVPDMALPPGGPGAERIASTPPNKGESRDVASPASPRQ